MTIDWDIAQALTSVRKLNDSITRLTDEQLHKLIELEEGASRRKIFLDKLYREARQRARKKFIRS